MWSLGIGLTIVFGLIIDQFLQPYGQYAVSAFVFGFFGFLIWKSTKEDQRKWWICLTLATLGEFVLSDLYGLYAYREGFIPLFVPPGHVLLYAAGLWTSAHLHKSIPWITLSLALIYSGYCLMNGIDQISLIFFALWILMFFKAELRPLISTMLIMALAMEILGTGLGNWKWAGEAAFLNLTLTQANPPFAVGVLYCGLDFLVGVLSRSTQKTLAGA